MYHLVVYKQKQEAISYLKRLILKIGSEIFFLFPIFFNVFTITPYFTKRIFPPPLLSHLFEEEETDIR